MSLIVPCQASDNPTNCRIQSHTTSSTSVRAGLDCQLIPSAPSPVDMRSPSVDDSDTLAGKNPK